MNNQVGRPKKAAKRTQLKFRYASLKPVERLKARQLRRYAFILLRTYALLPQVPATIQLLVNAAHIIHMRRRLLTNYCPLVHLRLRRTNMSRLNFPVQLCWGRLRFRKKHLGNLMLAFGIDDTTNVTLVNGSKINEGECFLFMLNRIASLQTLQELEVFWGRTNDQLSRMFNYMITRIYFGFKHLIQNNLNYWQPAFVNFIRCFQKKIELPVPLGCSQVGCTWDATVIGIANPGGGIIQQVLWNGKDRVHAIKFGNLAFPNGMIGDMQDCESGSRHDEVQVTRSNINGRLNNVQIAADTALAQHMIAYADKGLMNRSHIRTAFRGLHQNLQMWQIRENLVMKAPRGVSSELPFGEIKQQNKFLSYKKGLKVQMMAVNQIYIVAALMHNAHVCLYGSKVSEYFDCEAPTLYDFMQCADRNIPFF